MSKKSNVSLSEKINSLINTKPVLEEPDEDDFTTVDQIAEKDRDSDYSADELDLVQFRKLNIEFLDAEDNKYLGKKSSRVEHTKAFASDSSDFDDSTDDNTDLRSASPQIAGHDSDDASEENCSHEDDSDDKIEIHDDEEEENNNSSDGDSDDNENEDDNGGSDSDSKDDNVGEASALADLTNDRKSKQSNPNEETSQFNCSIFSKAGSDIDKGKAIKNQLHIWDLLLECRIKFQKCLSASNQLPKYDLLKKFESQGGSEFQNLIKQNKIALEKLLNSFFQLQDVTLQENCDYNSKSSTAKHKISDEEITSEESDEEGEKKQVTQGTKRLKLSDFSTEINERHKNFEEFRNKTIQKWNDKTRIGQVSSKNFNAFEQSTLKQIEHVLLDKQRLIKRTQIKRSNYHILGQTDGDDGPPKKVAKTEDSDAKRPETKVEGTIHKEIFDDDDFYHQLLSELLKRKANDITDPIQLGKQWIQLQKARSKMKKTVDTKASKGRKVRYVVHPKLVNFMMPINNPLYAEESRTELLNSIFGKAHK